MVINEDLISLLSELKYYSKEDKETMYYNKRDKAVDDRVQIRSRIYYDQLKLILEKHKIIPIKSKKSN